MKSKPHSIHIALFLTLISCLGLVQSSSAQGFNDNEWIFGYCGPNSENSYLSFGKGTSPSVQTLPGSVIVDRFSNALAIDPITGQPLFYSNGSIVYDFSGSPIQGQVGNLNGPIDTRQQVATGFLNYDPNGDKLFYLFYVSPAGQLLYTLIDMNAPGQATGNERPLGEITEQDQVIGNAQGAILVVKTPASPSYLISFDGGNLIARRLGNTAGDFTQTDTEAIPFTPKAIVFDADREQLILIPENPGDDILVLDFNTGSGNFGTPEPISESGDTDPIEGATFSPDGEFIYFSRGSQLFRIPTSDLSATPEEIPLDPQPSSVYDLKVGPDGELYFLYEEADGGPQFMGKIENPDETDLTALTVEMDPFAGTDFCGTIFPVFGPNADISPTVDFTWTPDEPCANNPVQLTSEILPENYQPISFNWEFDPPLTDSIGNPLPGEYTEEHFLIPADATQEQSITVTLTVTFADGQTIPVTKSITLTENNLEANFTPSDTTICEGQCVDIGALLEAQSTEGQQGGEAPPGGGGDNYEYFWSNFKEEGWTSRQENEVCLPGTYWVLVREPGSSCYAYAEIDVKVWDLQDQSNGIWYFGDGAGLNFNPDPDDPNAPTPRPIESPHPRSIPAGTTTITDSSGEVLFFTDGESVWDLNGDLMENGDNIGGDNTSSQSVIAVAVPQEPTLYYLFTTQASANGSNEVKFSLVDIKAENPSGVGNVVTKDNFLFSPSTEQSAALVNGDTTWVLFHELGNNTFRAYPVSSEGIGQPVFSSVGSNHGFNSGVGAMKFSPEGDKVAVTISEGGCNRLEIFDFDADTGELTEYALLDLGCDGEVYGLEFSDSGEKVFVSYRNGGPGVEEFTIRPVNDEDDPDAATCPTCFGNATTRPQIEACVLSTRNQISGTSGLDLGALQIGPDGNVYLAVVGSNQIGQILVGAGCNSTSTFNQDSVEPMPGTTNLGLPSFAQLGGSSIPEPALAGPARLCLDPDEGATATLEGGGEPDIDSYFWTITRDDGTVILENFGGPGDQFQTLDQVFTEPGLYTVNLNVTRCATPDYYDASLEIQVDAPPTLTLEADATLCSGNPVTLTAIDGYDPTEGIYDFLWTNAAGQVFGDENSNSITVDEESIYTVEVSFRVPDGLTTEEAALFETCPATAEVFVGPAFEFDINQDAQEVCYEDAVVTFAPDTPVTGEWYYEQDQNGTPVLIGEFFELALDISTLPGAGNYEIIFITQDPILDGCTVEKRVDLIVNELPLFAAVQTNPATDCTTADGGFEISMQADAEIVLIQETGETFTNVLSGDVFPIPNLLPGIYTIEAENQFGCIYIATVTVENSNPPVGYEFTVTSSDETCGPNGVEDGTISINFTNGTPAGGTYVITRQGDGLEFTGTIDQATINIDVPNGEYAVEVLDPTNCSIPDDQLFPVAERFAVEFSVPTNFTACEEFTFAPEPSGNLNFTLFEPSGATTLPDADGNFTITQTGTYTIRGEDPTGTDCPREIQIDATITAPIDFEVSSPIIDCQSGVFYEAILNNASPADVIFLWKDDLGTIVGRQQRFTPPNAGDYFLEVQPISGSQCPPNQVAFTAIVLEEDVDVELDVTPFCGDLETTNLVVLADLTTVANIEWYRVQGGTRTRIPEFDDAPVIEVSQEGTYEVLLRSAAGCDIGRASGIVVRSTIIPPIVPSGFTICAAEGVTTSINPGDYDNYSWNLNGEEVSTEAIFTPTLPGIYELRVSDNLGCEYVETFEVFEDCTLKVNFPTGVVLNDPSRNFVVYANEFIDEAEVFVFNRWGELIFYCEHENLEPAQAFCPWDGTANGELVPNGTYAVVVKFTSRDQNKTEQITRAITIIQ